MIGTRSRKDDGDTPFGGWLRAHPELDSRKHGFDAENLDYIWFQYTRGKLMLIEEKMHGAHSHAAQQDTHGIVHQALAYACANTTFERIYAGRSARIKYYGYFCIRFENTCPSDGRITISRLIHTDGLDYTREVTEDELLAFLKFDLVLFPPTA